MLLGRAGDETGKDFINSFVEKGFLGTLYRSDVAHRVLTHLTLYRS